MVVASIKLHQPKDLSIKDAQLLPHATKLSLVAAKTKYLLLSAKTLKVVLHRCATKLFSAVVSIKKLQLKATTTKAVHLLA